MNPRESSYFLSWKGARSGPFSLEQIRAQLATSEISRMHQIEVEGHWQVLDEFLSRADADTRTRADAETAQREAQLRQDYERQLADERARHQPPPREIEPEEPRSSLSHLLRKEPPVFPQPPPPPPPPLPPPRGDPPAEITRTSGLAIAALIMGLCNFIPYVGFFTWILALVFGHTALGQMKRDPGLDGRGMAIAGLAITYFLLVLGLTFAVLVFMNTQRLPNFFFK